MSELKERVTYHSGEWVPESKAAIHIYDSQFMYGDGVFEMVRTFKHKFFLLEEHIDRLYRSMKYMHIPFNKTKQEAIDLCLESFDRNKAHFPEGEECRVMINVSRGPLGIYKEVFELSKSQAWNEPTWIVNVWPLSKTAGILGHFYETGANAVIPSQRQIPSRLLENKVKNRSRFHYQMANIQVSSFGKDAMPLLLDEDGFITESTGANFLMIKDGKLIAPELRNMLRGSSMMYILEVLAPQIGLEVVHKNFEPYDVMNCDEAMFTGTFVNLLPCNRLNGIYLNADIKENPIGPVTQRICDAWSKNVGINFIGQIKDWSKNVSSVGISSAMLGSGGENE
jgi:branched-chain amino acid aminotransferase